MENNTENWKLKSIKIDFMTYGENKDKYQGVISFDNDEQESFSFKIRPDMANEYIGLMSKDIVKSANQLGEKLIKSLNLQNSQQVKK